MPSVAGADRIRTLPMPTIEAAVSLRMLSFTALALTDQRQLRKIGPYAPMQPAPIAVPNAVPRAEADAEDEPDRPEAPADVNADVRARRNSSHAAREARRRPSRRPDHPAAAVLSREARKHRNGCVATTGGVCVRHRRYGRGVIASTPSEWLAPFVVVVVVAVFAYLGGWVVKRQDVARSIATEADALLEEAQQLAADADEWTEDRLRAISRLAQTAGMRARRLNDEDINDRFAVCSLFLLDSQLAFREGQRYWAGEAIANIRVGLDAFSIPSLWPWQKGTRKRKRLFPTKAEYTARMQYDEDQVPDTHMIAQWQTEHGVR